MKWFPTWEEYESWRDSLPVEQQTDLDLITHVGHTPMQFLPNQCTACALNDKMAQSLLKWQEEV